MEIQSIPSKIHGLFTVLGRLSTTIAPSTSAIPATPAGEMDSPNTNTPTRAATTGSTDARMEARLDSMRWRPQV